MQLVPKPIVLVILDGWGHSETTASNAIKAAQTPVWDTLWENSPRTLLSASEESAGLPSGQMGNSEVGHMIMVCKMGQHCPTQPCRHSCASHC